MDSLQRRAHGAWAWLRFYSPLIAVVVIPLLLFWAVTAYSGSGRGGRDHQTCGSGRFTWDC